MSSIHIPYIFTARKRSLRRFCFHRCLSVDRGVSASRLPPPGRHLHSPWADTRPVHARIHPLPSACWDIHPPVQCMLGYGQQAGGTHPTGMHSCIENKKWVQSKFTVKFTFLIKPATPNSQSAQIVHLPTHTNTHREKHRFLDFRCAGFQHISAFESENHVIFYAMIYEWLTILLPFSWLFIRKNGALPLKSQSTLGYLCWRQEDHNKLWDREQVVGVNEICAWSKITIRHNC